MPNRSASKSAHGLQTLNLDQRGAHTLKCFCSHLWTQEGLFVTLWASAAQLAAARASVTLPGDLLRLVGGSGY